MAEAEYYLKAEFIEPLSEEKIFNIKQFFQEGVTAELFFKRHYEKPRDVFYPTFEKKFPEITKMLKWEGSFVEKMLPSCLRGHLDFGITHLDYGMEKDFINDRFNSQPGNTYVLYNTKVWDMATWDGIKIYLIKEFDAVDVGWISEDCIDPWLQIDAEDNEEIVNDLLSNKELLPILMGINPLLDKKIARELKK